jgi:mannose-1-phosphate guanylyltransferase
MDRKSWAVILAGGEGSRLKSLSRFIAGDDRPKQFCALFGGKTLLGRTRARVARAIPPQQTLFVVVKKHEPYYGAELGELDPSRIVVQPANAGTSAAILYSLLRLSRLDEDPIVAFFPTDHDYADEYRFTQAVQTAVEAAADYPDDLILLGAEADRPEEQYGWIEPGPPLSGDPSRGSLVRVNRFREKPSSWVARELFNRGCLWNTFVIVGRARTFLDVLCSAAPSVCQAFEPLRSTPEGQAEWECASHVYAEGLSGDFSHDVLAASTGRLAVLTLRNAGWSDLGTPERVRAVADSKARAWLRASESGSRA